MRRVATVVLASLVVGSCATPCSTAAIELDRTVAAELAELKAETEASIAQLQAKLDAIESGYCAFYRDPAHRPSRGR